MVSHLLNLILLTYEPSFNYCWDCTLVVCSLDLWLYHFIPVLLITFSFALWLHKLPEWRFCDFLSTEQMLYDSGSSRCLMLFSQCDLAPASPCLCFFEWWNTSNWLIVPVESLLILRKRWKIIFPLIIVAENFGFGWRCLSWVKFSGMDFSENFFFTCIQTHKMSGERKEECVLHCWSNAWVIVFSFTLYNSLLLLCYELLFAVWQT